MGTSPSCLSAERGETRLYSADATDQVGDDEGAGQRICDRPEDWKTRAAQYGSLRWRRPTYVSVHPNGRFLLVANYFGRSVAVLPILADGQFGDATDVENDSGEVGPTKATNAPPGGSRLAGTTGRMRT